MEKVTIHHPRGRLQADVPASAVTHWFAAGWQTGPLPPADTEPAPEPETQPELEPEPEPARPRSGRRRTGSTTT